MSSSRSRSATSGRSSSRSAAGSARTPSPGARCSTATGSTRWRVGPRPGARSRGRTASRTALRVRRAPPPAPAHGAGARNAIHGLVRWAALDASREREPHRVVLGARPRIRSPAIRSRSRSHRVRALGERPHASRTTATNIGPRAVPVRERRAPVPDARDADRRPTCCCACPGATVLRSDERGIPVGTAPVDGTELRLPHRTADRRDEARPRLHRPRARRGRPRARFVEAADGSG